MVANVGATDRRRLGGPVDVLACGAVSRLVDAVAAPRLGVGFRWLLASSWVSNLGDGIAMAAGPLLVASQTDDAFMVALAALVQWLPPLLFGLFAGALSDRLDRRLIVVTVDVLRAIVLVLVATTIVTGTASIAVVLVALFLLGSAEVFADNASQTLLPMLVRREDLALANAHAFVWGTTSVAVRQRAVPGELQGRVGSVNTVGVFGGLVVGSALGGLLAQRFGVTAPFWFAFAGSALFVVLIWGQLAHIAHEDDPAGR